MTRSREVARATVVPATTDVGALGRRELALVLAILITLARLLDGPGAWPVAGLVFVTAVLGAMHVAGAASRGAAFEAALIVGVGAFGAAGAIRLVPGGLMLLPIVAVAALAVEGGLRFETRLARSHTPVDDDERARVLAMTLVAAFLAFAGAVTLVPDELGAAASGDGPFVDPRVLAVAVADGIAALLLGYRLAVLRPGPRRVALEGAATFGGVVAVGAGAVRAIGVAPLLGCAILVLVFYLWDAVQSSVPTRRRDARFVWEFALLVVLGVVVVAWNARLR